MLKETLTLAKIVSIAKHASSGFTQRTLVSESGLSQSYCSRSLNTLVRAGALSTHKSAPTPNGLPGPVIYKYNDEWDGFDVSLEREKYGLEVTFNGKQFALEDAFHRLVTHAGANDYLTLTGNFRSAIANTMVFYISQDILAEREPNWDEYRSALQLAMSFINTQALNGSYDPNSSDAIAFRKAAGYYA